MYRVPGDGVMLHNDNNLYNRRSTRAISLPEYLNHVRFDKSRFFRN